MKTDTPKIIKKHTPQPASTEQPVSTRRRAEVGRDEPDENPQYLKSAAKRAYLDQKKVHIDDNQIVELLPLVHSIAKKIITFIKPPIPYEDLISAGTVGLVKAARDYDPSFQTEFKTYAYLRIKGAILDSLRSSSALPSAIHQEVRKVMHLSQSYYCQTGTLPTDDELASKLGISIDKLYETFENGRAQHFLSIDGFAEGDPILGEVLAATGSGQPEEHLEKAELVEKLTAAIQTLPEKQRQVILLYYHQQLTMKQIADLLDITEPRISQIHAAALFSLSVKLENSNEPG
jgi:RNA polymerase sigma factor for flagellar operon FliA